MRALLLASLLLLPGIARGDEIPVVEKQRALLEQHRHRLEDLLGEQTRRIGRLKAQPAGLQRDRQLAASLRESQALADRLTRLGGELRSLTQKLITLHDQALGRAGLSPAERASLQRRRGELAGELAGGATRIATGGRASPLDSPDDLEEKADLLQDSEEKVRNQLRQVQAKVASIEQRARLQRHARAVEDSPFVEDAPRRIGGARRVTTGTADAEGDRTAVLAPSGKVNSDSAPPSPSTGLAGETGPAVPSGGGPAHFPAEVRGGSDTVISIREVLDPALLRDPTGAESAGSLQARLAALKSASERLRQVAGHLASQAGDLRRRARSLRLQH